MNTDRTQRVSNTERQVGKRASFHVYYTHNGKPKFDALFPAQASTEDEARTTFTAFCKELRMRGVQITSVVACDQSVRV